MIMCSVGAMLIAAADDSPPLGIVTDRDIVKRIAHGADPAQATVGELLGPPLHTVGAGASLADATTVMRRHGVRRLPVVDKEGRLVGIVAVDDVLRIVARELADLAQVLEVELEHEHPVPSAHQRSL